MMTAKQCFEHLRTLSRTGDPNALSLAVTYIDQVPAEAINELVTLVRQISPPGRFGEEVLDILEARQRNSGDA
jgi:hypothetical protein